MPKSFIGGTVDLAEAQAFRRNAQKYYDNNQSEALEIAIRIFNNNIRKGNIPKLQTQTTSTLIFKDETQK